VTTACCRRLLHSTTITIKEGEDITTVTFFVIKPLKNVRAIIITFFCNKAIEKSNKSCHHLFFFSNTKKKMT